MENKEQQWNRADFRKQKYIEIHSQAGSGG